MADELSQLHGAHKALAAAKEAVDDELGALRPAHAELRGMHDKAASELATTKAALAKSQEARVFAEVRVRGWPHAHASSDLAARAGTARSHAGSRRRVPLQRCMHHPLLRVHAQSTPARPRARTPHAQGRLPEIEVLQKSLTKAHEELSGLRFKVEEQRGAAAAREAAAAADRAALEGQLSAASHAAERLQLESAAATSRASQHEKQLEELYKLCTMQQGGCRAVGGVRQCTCAFELCWSCVH